jgi:hypothetical protein
MTLGGFVVHQKRFTEADASNCANCEGRLTWTRVGPAQVDGSEHAGRQIGPVDPRRALVAKGAYLLGACQSQSVGSGSIGS